MITILYIVRSLSFMELFDNNLIFENQTCKHYFHLLIFLIYYLVSNNIFKTQVEFWKKKSFKHAKNSNVISKTIVSQWWENNHLTCQSSVLDLVLTCWSYMLDRPLACYFCMLNWLWRVEHLSILEVDVIKEVSYS